MKPKIYLWCVSAEGWGPADVIGYALAEDGTGLASHLSSCLSWAKHDMGLTSDWKHDGYRKHYPDGFELVWLEPEELSGHEAFNAALAINKAKAAEEEPAA